MAETPKEAAKRLAGPMLSQGYKAAALHAYTDEKGEALYWRIRAKHPDTGEKWIRPMYLNGRGFELGEPKYPDGKPLYGLHRIASKPEAVVWITEGEQKADALNKLGLVATTTGGATSAGTADWRPLRGRACIIWPDNDEPGKAYAGEVASILLDLGCSVRCVEVDKLGLAEGEDAIQWLEARPEASRGDLEGLPMRWASPMAQNAPNREFEAEVELVRGCDIPPEAVRWLWKGWLAAGKFQILGGAPGTGKTTISMALAATVTTGGRWPDGSRAEQGNVVIWSGEDDPADTLIPRLALSGADLNRVYFVSDVLKDGVRRAFDPARDTEALGRKLAEIGGVRLLIVDPIVSAISGDSHKNAEVRRGLQPLANLASEMGCALLGITHFSKGTGGRDPVERLTGSLAFGALARVVLVAAKHQAEGNDGRTVRLFLRAKSNIGPDDGGFEYDLHQSELQAHPGLFASSVLWGNPVEGAARELLATADARDDDGEGGTLADAKQFLADLLADGPMPVKAIRSDADGAGYSWATIRRAQKALGVEAIKAGMKSGWEWSYARRRSEKHEDAQQKGLSTFANIEHLRQSDEAEAFAERAAIMEFEGGIERSDAEHRAANGGRT
jgi:putative DNA primase/helicase